MEPREKIKYLREKKNLNQKQLAEKAGLNKSVMNRIETGSRPITEKELALFADILESSADYILGRESLAEPQNNLMTDMDIGCSLEKIYTMLKSGDSVILYGKVMTEKDKKIVMLSVSHTIGIAREIKN